MLKRNVNDARILIVVGDVVGGLDLGWVPGHVIVAPDIDGELQLAGAVSGAVIASGTHQTDTLLLRAVAWAFSRNLLGNFSLRGLGSEHLAVTIIILTISKRVLFGTAAVGRVSVMANVEIDSGRLFGVGTSRSPIPVQILEQLEIVESGVGEFVTRVR